MAGRWSHLAHRADARHDVHPAHRPRDDRVAHTQMAAGHNYTCHSYADHDHTVMAHIVMASAYMADVPDRPRDDRVAGSEVAAGHNYASHTYIGF